MNVSSAEHNLMVSANLPAGYLSCKPLGLGKGLAGPEIKPVDNGKEIFKLQLRMVSTVQAKDQFLHTFFVHCHKVLDRGLVTSTTINDVKVSRVCISGRFWVGSSSGCSNFTFGVRFASVPRRPLQFFPRLGKDAPSRVRAYQRWKA